ncbi:uncharacterized protein LOC121375899 isoform X2 [Gigantopelta aegis]|uniref:uncharacterized protein LOC121375899 isoform X2 n=1 Tax=Gigantopelta aegis TaxID=1735272 RepID=UPI001B88AFD8|nr:uncharacterized protein LOC121375899 isoform X2 [Gigantopelta aegis]
MATARGAKEKEFTLPFIQKSSSPRRRCSPSRPTTVAIGHPSKDVSGTKTGFYDFAPLILEADDMFGDFGSEGLFPVDGFQEDSKETAKRNAEKAAEFEVEHNWVLKEAEERQYKKFDVIKRRVTIPLPDDDPLDSIQHRLAEVQSMLKPKAELSSFLSEMDPEQRERILKIAHTDVEVLRQERLKRRNKPRLYWAGYMVCLIAKVAVPRKREFNPDDPDVPITVLRRMRKKNPGSPPSNKTGFKSSLSFEMQMAMSTRPECRTQQNIRRVMWVLKATKAFTYLFPSEMEREVARVVAYERYEDNRHIAYQGRPAERFYYVLSGRVQQLREYRLTSGCVNKLMGSLKKGMTSQRDELEKKWPREYHLVSKGPVEVLVLHRDDFVRLQHTTQGPPIDFLWSLNLFKEFPCEEFLTNPEAIEFKYYGENRLVAKDGYRTPWLHVVKSGYVKVVRIQHVLDVRNDTMFASQSTEELGCGKLFSHAKAMLGILAQQRKMKALSQVSLPDVLKRRHTKDSVSPNGSTDRRKNKKKETKLPVQSGIEENSKEDDPPVLEEKPVVMPEVHVHSANSSPTLIITPTRPKDNVELPPIIVTQSSPRKEVSSPTKQLGSHLHPHSTFLTRERTEADPKLSHRKRKDIQQRRAYLQLDLLGPGDVFGLENLDPPPVRQPDGPAISLVSDGAEVIRISKRFFLQYAQNNTMLRVETMQREYLTTEEAKDILYDKETWSQYKNVLMQRLIQNLTARD